MGKILSQSGIALADIYQIEGSIVGVEKLETNEVPVVHELGGTIVSERLRGIQLLLSTTPLQSADFSVSSGQVADCPNRIIAASVFIPAAMAGDVGTCNLSIEDGGTGRQTVFWSFDSAVDAESAIRWNDGTGVLDMIELRPGRITLPSLMVRVDVGTNMPVVRLQGTTTAFGAGTVEIQALVHLVRANSGTPQQGQASSHGLPLPSW